MFIGFLNYDIWWWFHTFLIFTPKIGEDSHFEEHTFQLGGLANQPSPAKPVNIVTDLISEKATWDSSSRIICAQYIFI